MDKLSKVGGLAYTLACTVYLGKLPESWTDAVMVAGYSEVTSRIPFIGQKRLSTFIHTELQCYVVHKPIVKLLHNNLVIL